jgi:hypothetical protein
MHIKTRELDHPKLTGQTDKATSDGNPCNYDNYSSHSQVAAGYKESSYQSDDRRNSEYRNDNRDDSNRQYQPRSSRAYNQSPEDMLNGPCHMHYTYIDGKRVSRQAMKGYRTFLKLQEAVGFKQAEAKSQGYGGAANNTTSANQQPTIGAPQGQGQPDKSNENDGGYIPSKGDLAAMIQSVPKSNKDQKSISRQVNLTINSPPAHIEYLHWSEQPIEFSREDHPITVPRPGNTPLVLKAQVGGYDVDKVFMDAGSGINLIYAKTLRARCKLSTGSHCTRCLLWQSFKL